MNTKKALSAFMSVIMTAALSGQYSSYASGNEETILEKYFISSSYEAEYNMSYNSYNQYASILNSYINENGDGTISRTEYMGSGGCVISETYSDSFELLGSSVIDAELPVFGGFYSGESANYLVFGQSNSGESDSTEIMRVVKYSKNWERLDSFSAYGANTVYPFNFGSLRMTEVNGLLYVYTCHVMYQTYDGLNHQSNMTFVIDTDTMEETQSYYDVMNISWGYVSHSFNQFIQTDGEYVYRADHGDAYPRGISITKCKAGEDITDVSYTTAFPIQGNTGNNYTGTSVGGFELSGQNCLIAGNSVDQSSETAFSESSQRNIFLSVTDKDLEKSNTIWLTDYAEGSSITPRTPQLVKFGEERFLVMWEEYDSTLGSTCVKLVTVDDNGAALSDIIEADVRLSDCQPVLTSDNTVIWYVTDSARTTLYSLKPQALESCTDTSITAAAPQNNGDMDNNGAIDISDATLVLTCYSKQAAGISTEDFTEAQIKAADINTDGKVDISDATEILTIYATNAAGL